MCTTRLRQSEDKMSAEARAEAAEARVAALETENAELQAMVAKLTAQLGVVGDAPSAASPEPEEAEPPTAKDEGAEARRDRRGARHRPRRVLLSRAAEKRGISWRTQQEASACTVGCSRLTLGRVLPRPKEFEKKKTRIDCSECSAEWRKRSDGIGGKIGWD